MKKSKKQKLKEECIKIASDKKLEEHPKCMFCNLPAICCHHFVRQSRSNYLRCEPKNLIPICKKCHFKLHNGYEAMMTLELVKIFGNKWAEDLMRDSRKTIKDDIPYWEKLKIKLNK